MSKRIASELNSVAETLGVRNRVVFYDGDTVQVVKTVAPYGKVAVLYAKNTFLANGKDFTARLKAADIIPLNFILPDGVALSPKNIFEVIGVPEDVRAIVYFDSVLTDIAAYLATIFNIPVVRTIETVETENVIGARLPFFWGDKTDFVEARCVYHIILNVNPERGDVAKQFVNVVSKLSALTDYRVKIKACGGKSIKAEYDIIKSAVESALAVQDSIEETLVTAGLKIELANLVKSGALICNSAEYSFKRLCNFDIPSGAAFAFFEKQTRLYALFAEEGEVPFIACNYNARACELAEITGSDDGAFLKGLLQQIDFIKKADIVKIKSDLKKEILSQQSALRLAEERFTALGGKKCKDFSPYVAALKCSGDLPDTFNFMTVLRESGFTENL